MTTQCIPTLTSIFGATALLGAAACATTPPTTELVEARKAYDRARTGYADRYVPDQVYQAELALQRAERSHARHPGSKSERHAAYLAHRRAEMALTLADERVAQADLHAAAEEKEWVLRSQRDTARGKLQAYEEKLIRTEAELHAEESAAVSR